MKKILVAGNWKMNTNAFESRKLAEYIVGGVKDKNYKFDILICPPFTSLQSTNEVVNGTKVALGAQNCHTAEKGAYTGEISIGMLKHIGCEYIIIGHSERRTYFKESDEFINQKAKAILAAELKPIICIGETLEERQQNKTFPVLEKQLKGCLEGIDYTENIIIAYEPVWAIGTGLAATVEQVQEAHAFIRYELKGYYGELAKNIIILYGGSVTADNAEGLFALDDVNGGLIGGASLNPETFLTIIRTADKVLCE